MKRITAMLSLLAVVASPVLARELAGVTLPDTVNVEGRTLRLNGMGVRTKFFFKVYVAGLYLEKPARSGDLAATSEQVKRVELRMLRDVDRAKITEAIAEGFQKNSRPQLGALKPRLDRFSAMIPNLRAGDRIVMTYVPGKGTTVVVQTTIKGTLEGKDFADALFNVWLGRSPVQEDLKAGLLGG